MKGDFMKPFTSFYDPKAMDAPLTLKEVEKITKKILKEIENAMRQTRSGRNLNCQIKNTH